MGQANIRLKLRVRSSKENLLEFSKRGDMKAICHLLTSAEQKGLLRDKHVLMDTLHIISRNFHVRGKTGGRFS